MVLHHIHEKVISPLVLAHPIFIEETFAVGSAITGPQSSDSVTTEWEVGQDVNHNFTWE